MCMSVYKLEISKKIRVIRICVCMCENDEVVREIDSECKENRHEYVKV